MVTFTHQLTKLGKFVLIPLAGVAIFSYFLSDAIAEQTVEPSAEPNVGSLALSDLNETLLNQSAELNEEVTQALEEAGGDVGCVAPLVRFSFISDLNNSRIAPFSCFFTDNKSLTIQARNIAILPNGETMLLEELLKRNNIPEGVDLRFELISWQWTGANHQSAANEAINER